MGNIMFLVTESKSANGICCTAVMKELKSQGMNIFCITNKEFDYDKEFVKDGIKYYTIKPRLIYRIDSFLMNSTHSKFIEKILTMCRQIINKGKLCLAYFSWPLISPMYTRRIYLMAKKIVRNNCIDTLIPIYTQIDTLIVSNKIKKKNKDLRYIPYFLDSLSGGYGPKVFSKEWTMKRGIKWEKKLLPNADKIIMMQSSRQHYEKNCSSFDYFDRIIFLDLPLFSPHVLEPRDTEWEFEDGTINLLFIGTIPIHIRPIEYFIELFLRLTDARLRFHIIGSSTCESYLKEVARKDSRIRLHPFISHEEAILAMKATDFLVNLGNNNTYMTPSKIFEYMSLGKPIISTAPIHDEPSIVYLEKYPVKHIVYYKNEINGEFVALKEFIMKAYKTRVDVQQLEREFYNNTPKAFASCIRKN